MGWWIFRGITAAGYIIWVWYDGGDMQQCTFDPDPDVQAVYCY